MKKENGQDLQALGAMAALDCLAAEEARSWQNRLAAGGDSGEEAASFKNVIEGLGFLADEVCPPALLKTRLLARMRAAQGAVEAVVEQRWNRWPDTLVAEDLTIVQAEDVAWESLGKGIQVKNLFVSRAEDKVVMLVKMEAGGSYPPHVHSGPEECFVLSGDLYGENFSMQAGDFQRAAAGSVHGVQSTKNGCVILITSSLHDELIGRDTASMISC